MERWLSAKVGLGLLAAFYVLSFPYHPGLRSPNELCRLWQSRAIVDHHTLTLNETMREFGPVGDLSCAGTFEVGGRTVLAPCLQPPVGGQLLEARYYPSKAPLLSFLGAPVYWALQSLGKPVTELAQMYFSRLFITVLPTLGLLWVLRRFLAAFVPRWSDVLVVVYGLGTMALSYSQQFMSHQVTAVLLFGAFFCAWQVERGAWRERGYLLAGVAAGAAVAGEYTAALTVLCLAVYVVVQRWGRWGALARAAGLVAAGAAPLVAFLMAYHQSAYGHPLESGYRWLNDAGYQHWHVGGFLGIRTPSLTTLGLSFFSPLRGFFTLSPFLLLALWGMRRLRALDRSQFAMVVALVVANAYFISSFDYSSWGWTVGPRHLVPLVAFLLLPVGFALESLHGKSWKFGVAAGLCLSSVLVSGVVSFVNYIPDDVSTALFGVAVPVLRGGNWPISVLAAVVPNPGSGVLLVGLLGLAMLWVFLRFRKEGAGGALLAAGAALHIALLWSATTHDAHDLGAQRHLSSLWGAPNGARLRILP